MTYPTPFIVEHEVAEVVAEDDLGNSSVIFAAPVEVAVISIAPAVVETLSGRGETAYASRGITDVDVYAPTSFKPGLQDRITLPDGDLYEVIGVSDWSMGFHLWPAGNVIKLKRVTG